MDTEFDTLDVTIFMGSGHCVLCFQNPNPGVKIDYQIFDTDDFSNYLT